ncbi:hypothetical protein [Cumulibacter manganitolerans]|uniref:hypothetical protein n=1 Tax=Cumulibacter manganitolerans TaxID=1884992 RepID=UPI001297CEA6|nr:hypothetical protein [Cumulibacter manganitolerans]
MTDSPDAPHPDTTARKRPHTVRAAALGLLALAALIAAVALFGKDDDRGSAAGEQSSASATSASSAPTTSSAASSSAPTTTSAPPVQTTPAQPTPTDATSGQSEAPAPPGVTVLITSQTWNAGTKSIEVVGSVQGIATETSTCTATATMGTTSASASVPGTFDGQGTSCGLISISMSGRPSGTYQVVIAFDAGNGVAKSKPVSVDVP